MRLVVAGNWKMNHGPQRTAAFFRSLAGTLPDPSERASVTILIFPPAVSLPAAVEASRAMGGIGLGVQHVHTDVAGAFTGETSAEMAREAGAGHVLVGHSERRHLFGETDAETAARVRAGLRAGLVPVLCVGETRDERRAGRLREVLIRQVEAVFGPQAESDPIHAETPILLAYEPVWAIGTGDTATPDDAAEAHGILRDRMGELVTPARAAGIPILYGGSVGTGNAAELLSTPGVDGALIGGASLDPDSFSAIVRTAVALC